MPIRVSRISIAEAPISGSSDSVRKPCAMVVPNGPGRRAHRVDVDPLAVAGRLGEAVDARLVDRDPVADADLLADPIGQIAEAFETVHARASSDRPGAGRACCGHLRLC